MWSASKSVCSTKAPGSVRLTKKCKAMCAMYSVYQLVGALSCWSVCRPGVRAVVQSASKFPTAQSSRIWLHRTYKHTE